jgi:hypothetical protein
MRFARLTLICAVVSLAAGLLPAYAQGVRFISPQDGDTVRDMVRLEATKPSPNSGWISYKVEKSGKGDFVAAVTQPFVHSWNTRAQDDKGKALYGDGQYTITAVALSPRGRKVGEVSITVTVKNAISSSDRPQAVQPVLAYERNDEVYYTAHGSWTIKPAADEEEPDDVYEMAKDANGAMVANWKNKVMSPTEAGGRAVLHVVVGSSGEQMGSEDVTTFDEAGKSHTYLAMPDGTMRLKHDDESPFRYVELFLQLPDRPLKKGDRWTSELRMLPVPQMDTEIKTVRAKHRVEGFEWVAGHKCLVIRSTFSVKADKLKLRLSPQQAQQEGVFGGGEPMDMMGMDAMMTMEPGGMDMGMGMEGDMGMGGMGGGAPELESDYSGERVTYWAFDVNRPVRIVDSITHTLEIERTSMTMEGMAGGEFMPGMDMMPVDPGMQGPPGEDPAMAGAPGMPGEPGMDQMAFEGGMGMGGMGMQQIEPVEPLKVRINVSLIIEEVPHAQGVR